MLTNPPPPKFRRRPPRAKAPRYAPPPALTLVSAMYPIEIEGAMRLRFDREIDIAAFDGTQVIVKDGVNQASIMNATGPAELSDPQTVVLYLVIIGSYSESNVLLSATGASGIVAVAPPVGGKWPGVTDAPLPFPPPAASAIVSVVHSDTDTDRVVVTTNEQVTTLEDVAAALQVSVDGVTWLTPILFGQPDANVVVVIFSADVTAATLWRVPDPAVWEFTAGGPMNAPFSGSIE